MATNNAVNTTLSGQSGTGSFAGTTSPTFTTPILGTPTSGNLSNCTALPVGSITGLGSGVATWLATPSSANLASAVTDETGSGALVFANTPTLVTPVLGAATATSINFGGSSLSTYAANTSWTPVVTFATPGDLSVSYSTQTGSYSRIGNMITATFSLAFTPTFTTASGAISITGLPASAGSSAYGSCFLQAPTFPAGVTSICLQLVVSTSALKVIGSGSAIAATSFTATQFPTSVAAIIQGSISYLV